jgi:hypothetical protein
MLLNFFCQQMHSLLKYKMLQLTFKISLCGLLHVSVCSDHHQGAMPNLAKVAVFVELSIKYIVKNIAVLWQYVFQSVQQCVYCVLCGV